MPKVSVVMPSYNVEAFIAGAIKSVLNQSFTDFELLIVDDGSTDGTRAIYESFNDCRIRVVRQKNRGLAGARNAGIRESRGDYLAFLDADDRWRDDKLSRHVAHLDRDPSVGVSFSASQFMGEDGSLLELFQQPKLTGLNADSILCRNPIGNGSAPVIRRETLLEVSKLDTRYGAPEPVVFDPDFRQSEDIECWVRIAATTHWRFEGLPEPLTLYRLNSGGLSASVDKQLASWERFIDKASRYAPALIQRSANIARAYQYRYLARRSIWSGEAALACRMMTRALISDRRILWREPGRTLSTLFASVLQYCLPLRWYRGLETLAIKTQRASRRSQA
ncbi:MAG: glycosyltransferase family 2 protein [Pseudomonadota bacterium]